MGSHGLVARSYAGAQPQAVVVMRVDAALADCAVVRPQPLKGPAQLAPPPRHPRPLPPCARPAELAQFSEAALTKSVAVRSSRFWTARCTHCCPGRPAFLRMHRSCGGRCHYNQRQLLSW